MNRSQIYFLLFLAWFIGGGIIGIFHPIGILMIGLPGFFSGPILIFLLLYWFYEGLGQTSSDSPTKEEG